ncbi:hypothetical protein [Streptomyces sp. ST2-7A]|uniref:hypothetical protein n=1 Tax=Streptomyces sp. ST2-7A TaxID=2907214 RepID=UPI001F17A1F2|nr:hypothetical protein [Streptomyces sp. ST2-7A]MCE7083339.1 hypothetical protein [Streptomyces sp. ST2-7A]
MTSDSVRPTAHGLCCGAICRQAGDARSADGIRRATRGSLLCGGCRRRFEQELGQLPRFYHACGEALGGAQAPNGLRERTSGGQRPGLPFNTAAAEVRATAMAVLSSWSSLVVEGRLVRPPHRTIDEMAAFLLRHSDWLCTHPAIGDATAETAQLVRSARRVTELPTLRRVGVGSCPMPGCAGELTAAVPGAGSAGPTLIGCGTDTAHQWSVHEWAQLRQRARAAGAAAPGTAVAWLSASDIASMSGLPKGRVYQLASRDKWRRQARRGRAFYYEGDVLRTLPGRRPRLP